MTPLFRDGQWKEAPKATTFAEREFQVCVTARLVEDERTYWVAAGGGPMYASCSPSGSTRRTRST